MPPVLSEQMNLHLQHDHGARTAILLTGSEGPIDSVVCMRMHRAKAQTSGRCGALRAAILRRIGDPSPIWTDSTSQRRLGFSYRHASGTQVSERAVEQRASIAGSLPSTHTTHAGSKLVRVCTYCSDGKTACSSLYPAVCITPKHRDGRGLGWTEPSARPLMGRCWG